MFAKCANAACAQTFEYHSRGNFFRFSRGNAKLSLSLGITNEVGNAHDVEHYWLCSRCARMYSLVYVEGTGVILKPLWTEQPVSLGLHNTVAV